MTARYRACGQLLGSCESQGASGTLAEATSRQPRAGGSAPVLWLRAARLDSELSLNSHRLFHRRHPRRQYLFENIRLHTAYVTECRPFDCSNAPHGRRSRCRGGHRSADYPSASPLLRSGRNTGFSGLVSPAAERRGLLVLLNNSLRREEGRGLRQGPGSRGRTGDEVVGLILGQGAERGRSIRQSPQPIRPS
jgi:hypothetical protein